jgi:hypothetical protein
MRLLKDQEALCRRLNDPAGLQACLGNRALILKARGDLDGAMRLHKEEEALCRRLNDPNGLAISLANQASVLAFNQARPAEALPLAEEALGIATRHGLVALAGQIGPIVSQIQNLLNDPGTLP